MDQERGSAPGSSRGSSAAHHRADLPETGLRSSQPVPAPTMDGAAFKAPEATQPTTQASLQSTLPASTIFESWLPMDSEIFGKRNGNARPLASLRCEYGLSVKPNIAQHSISTGALSNRVVSAGDNMNGSKT